MSLGFYLIITTQNSRDSIFTNLHSEHRNHWAAQIIIFAFVEINMVFHWYELQMASRILQASCTYGSFVMIRKCQL